MKIITYSEEGIVNDDKTITLAGVPLSTIKVTPLEVPKEDIADFISEKAAEIKEENEKSLSIKAAMSLKGSAVIVILKKLTT